MVSFSHVHKNYKMGNWNMSNYGIAKLSSKMLFRAVQMSSCHKIRESKQTLNIISLIYCVLIILNE